MSVIVVRYRPRDDRADENQHLVEAVFAELTASRSAGLAYTVWRLADGSFIHVADIDGDSNPLPESTAFRRFLSEIDDRCEPGDRPIGQSAICVGTYRQPAAREV